MYMQKIFKNHKIYRFFLLKFQRLYGIYILTNWFIHGKINISKERRTKQ